jgi:hypothetical protein
MKKVIFIYWAQKFINAPIVVKKCLLSWKLKNPTWEIIELNDDNLSEYINIEEEIPDIQKKNITKTSYSDIIRIFLLAKHGGCWCDATTFCNQSLDIWLNKNISTNFFGFELKSDRMLSSWFLYSEKHNYIIQEWKRNVIEYVNNINILGTNIVHTSLNIWKKDKYDHKHYFWFHYLFGDLYNSDNKFKELWDSTPKISADGPHYILKQGLLNKLSDKVKNHINEVKTPLYKLTYRYDIKKCNEKCNLSYLMNSINLKFIHIGKCGGTNVCKKLYPNKNTGDYHLKRNYKSDEKYIIWIRNPLERFVSAFNMSYNIINADTSNLNKNNLTLDNCLAPERFRYKMTHDHTFTKRYDYLINYFKTANKLAESITSKNETEKKLALELMNSEQEHIFKSIGWYLYNGNFIEKNYDKIVFVGSCENMTNDIKKLSNLLNIQNNSKEKNRENKNNNDKFLSYKAIKNIINFYKDTDYEALRKLLKYNFISNDIYNRYFYYFYKNLYFIHIPKTAGTSIENAAKNNNLLWGRFDTTLKSSKNIPAWHCPQEILPYCFCVIRNPFDRFISQFYHDNEIKNYNSEKLNKYIEVKIPLIKNNMNISDNHFLPQYKFYEKCHIIISFDNLQNNLNNLMKMFNLPLLVLDKLPGGKVQQEKRDKITINKLTYLDINEKNKDLIKQIYKLDFELYNNVKNLGILIKKI